MFKTDNNMFVFVASAVDTTHAGGIATPGELLFLDETGTNEAAVTAGEKFRIVQYDADGNQRATPLLKYDNYINVNNVAKSDRVLQVSTWGWNGTAGSIDNVNSNRYTVRVNFTHNVDMFSEQSDLHFFEYVSDASATELEIADNIQQKMAANGPVFSGKTSGKDRAYAKVSLLSAAVATGNVASSSGTAAFVNGSKSVTIGNTPAFAAGDYITAAADDATPRYKVVDVTGNVATLSTPYAEATETVNDGTCKYIAAATMAAAAAGLQITGVTPKFTVGLHKDMVVSFNVTLDGWGDTTAISTTAPSKGVGHSREVAELEWFAHGAVGAYYRQGVPNNSDLITAVTAGVDAAVTADYNMTFVDAVLDDPYHAVAGSGKGRVQIVIAYSGTASDVSTHLPTRLIG